MSWERDPLWAKAKLFMQRAFEESREDPAFGLWCSLGLELLARAALASISPTLLAEPDEDHKYLLHALNRGSERTPRKSLKANHVFALCHTLFAKFSEDDLKISLALLNRRNEELHSGAAAFNDFRLNQWLAGFYRACRDLGSAMGETLESLFGADEAAIAAETLETDRNDARQRVQSSIAAHRRVFEAKEVADRQAAKVRAEEEGVELAKQRHHRVTCPACQCVATVQGKPFGKEHITHGDGEILVRQAVCPTSFSCGACGLKLQGYAELEVAGLGGQHTRTTTLSPEEYYGLFSEADLEQRVEEYMADQFQEYDNED